jgi:SOS-response transcriptional repressor LexA
VADVVTLCPLISWAQACETVLPKPSEQRIAENILPCPVRYSHGTFILRVKGASIEPRFYNGDLIFVDPEVVPESGKHAVVKLEDTD